ncbi:hypothetical protein NM688_g4511 [Phlebia brevispora]|uniref:Uncharacterized protein n=1 Tax=Phlebia brevispora TaxID=194682 RepID=A0ACC1T328_9APHY|nr:hypothetical protein NM688_g4511 [Phlebia brevispora]
MDDQEIAELAREYGLDMSDYDDDIHAPDYQTTHCTVQYDDYEDFNDEPAPYSSPCPPERGTSHFRGGTQYRPGQHQLPYTPPSSFRGDVQHKFYARSDCFLCVPFIASVGILDYETSPLIFQHRTLDQPGRMASRAKRARIGDTPASRKRRQSAEYSWYKATTYIRSTCVVVARSFGIQCLRLAADFSRIHARSVRFIADMYRSLFKFPAFNAVQSTCYDNVMNTDQNMVVSGENQILLRTQLGTESYTAPTGSGKTVLFELSIVRMLMQSSTGGRSSKCIYVAPTKALCSEKANDWSSKFQTLGVKCCELTGDTVHFGKSAWGDARDASIIVTTAEKWDSLTRNWEDHEQILGQIQLFLVDEVHILNESRGSTLEVVVSRMKARGSSVRFILVSATVPNIIDVAAWIGNSPYGDRAIVMEFGEEYRPCKLKRFVYGFPRKKDQNDFVFSRLLDYRLYGILKEHSSNRPILIFCSTRKGVGATAEQLFKEYEEATQQKQTMPWSRPRRIEHTFHDSRLNKLAAAGIGMHHAGMNLDDRKATERLFLAKLLSVVVATSTLAVGVNLPAHIVVIKGVRIFQNNASQEYSDLDIMQMLGRAGRPQFDKEGIAIILCESELEAKYKALAQGQTILESCLHRNLAEHLNAEIGLGTISTIDSAKRWLQSSFLFQRIKQNPRHYAIGKEVNQSWQEKIDEMVIESVKKLQESQLVSQSDDDNSLASTEYGDIMSKMSSILGLPERVAMRDLIEILASADEFSDIKFRSGEKQIYNKLRQHDDIRFKPKKVEKSSDKVSLIIQAILGGINLNDAELKNGDNQPSLEALTIFRHVSRIARVIVEVAIARKSGSQAKFGMELMRCLSAKAWEDRPLVLRQIENVGEKSYVISPFHSANNAQDGFGKGSRHVASSIHGIISFAALAKQDPMRIEVLLNRKPPFGHQILAFVKQLPKYWVKVKQIEVTASDGQQPIELELAIECGVEEESDAPKINKPKSKFRDTTLVLTTTSDLDFIDFRRISTKALKSPKSFTVTAQLTKPSQTVLVQIASENTAGVTVNEIYKPHVSHAQYPVINTRPPTSLEVDMDGLADDPDFWHQMQYVPSDEEPDMPVVDLTKSKASGSKLVPNGQQSRKPEQFGSRSKQAEKAGHIPERLPNGNYICAHTCKDKTTCKHLCCREGTEKPPQWSRKRVETLYPTEGPQSTTSGTSKQKSKPKAKTQEKPDPRLKHLEDLHKTTDVKGNIRLSEGQRIRLDASSRPSLMDKLKKPKPVPKFDVDLADLTEGDVSAPAVDAESLDPSDDELPDVHDIIASSYNTKQRLPSSEKRYSDPAFDDLVRNVPLSDCGDEDPCSTRLRKTRAKESSASSLRASSSKRPCEGSPGPSGKRLRPSPEDDEVEILATPPRLQHSMFGGSGQRRAISMASPLFLAASSDGDVEMQSTHEPDLTTPDLTMESNQWDEEFELDHSLFDVQPSSTVPYSPNRRFSTVNNANQQAREVPHPIANTYQFDSKPEPNAQAAVQETESMQDNDQDGKDPDDIHDERLAELFAWMESDNVIIVNKMDTN